MDAFRWVLLSIGVIIFLLIFFLSKKKSTDSDWENDKIEPGFIASDNETNTEAYATDDSQSSLNSLAENIQFDDGGDSRFSFSPPQQDAINKTSTSQEDASSETKLIALYLVEKHGGMLTGSDIIESLEQAGMRYGDMKIFHYISDHDKADSSSVFSIANLIEPGWFDLISISNMKTPGLTIFLNLPGPINGIRAFDEMVVVINKLEKLLPVTLKDKSRNNVSKQMLMHMREEVAEFDRMKAMS